MERLRESFLSLGVATALLILVGCIMALVASDRHVAAAPETCNVVVVIDRSDSIGDNWTTLRDQVRSLFDPNQLGGRSDIKLAFWTFSHQSNPGTNNFNSPYNGYVPVDPVGKADLEASLPADKNSVLGGQTNYAQGFGYNPTSISPLVLDQNSDSDIRSIASQANAIAFLTDGAPNYPGNGDNNLDAITAGNVARNKFPSDVAVYGGYINADPDSTNIPESLYRTINGPVVGSVDLNASNVGPVGGGFTGLASYLAGVIAEACGPPASDYSLQPVVQPQSTVVIPGNKPSFDYSVNNVGELNGTSDWQAMNVVVKPGATISFNCGSGYCDTTWTDPCSTVRSRVSGTGNVTECNTASAAGDTGSTSGSQSFPQQAAPFSLGTGTAGNDADSYAIGTRICRILVLKNATGSGGARLFGDCSTIGKTPLVQIHGGDVRVGRQLNTSSSADLSAGVYTSQFRITEGASAPPSGRTYGSWVEYGVLAPGPVSRFASLSGLAGANGGYDSQVVSNTCDKNINKLTFANTVAASAHTNECGYLAESPGLVPNLVSSLTSGTPVSPTPQPLDPNTANGLYQNTDPNAVFTVAGGTVPKGKTIIVYVPHGTVTITGAVHYVDDVGDKYRLITDIPQMVIIAKDINISKDVDNVDAWLVAGDGSSGGTIDTCSGFTGSLTSDVCDLPLKINGPVIARQLDLWRTKVDKSDPACKIDTPSSCANSGDPAEIINLPASSILWARAYKQNDVRAQTTYTTELPPFF